MSIFTKLPDCNGSSIGFGFGAGYVPYIGTVCGKSNYPPKNNQTFFYGEVFIYNLTQTIKGAGGLFF